MGADLSTFRPMDKQECRKSLGWSPGTSAWCPIQQQQPRREAHGHPAQAVVGGYTRAGEAKRLEGSYRAPFLRIPDARADERR